MTRSLRSRLHPFLLAIPLALSAAQASAQAIPPVAEWSPYIQAATLNSYMAADTDVQVIDIRQSKYLKHGTVPGAVWIPFAEWRGPADQPGRMLEEAQLAALLGANGIDLSKPIVVHNHNGKTIQTGRAAIVYWILKSAGATDIAVLDGGFTGWTDADLVVGDDHAPVDPTIVQVSYSEEWWADAMDIFAVASGQQGGAILDARLDSQVRRSVETGEPMMSMPMARYIPASLFMNPMSSRNLTAEGQAAFLDALTDRGIQPGEGFLVSVCQTGELSALSWFYASEILELEDVMYYPDALRGWDSDGGLMFGMAHTQ